MNKPRKTHIIIYFLSFSFVFSKKELTLHRLSEYCVLIAMFLFFTVFAHCHGPVA